ncbi:MAG: hypothetical protein B7X60_00695 [Polynucleobacter sp. 39-45-136]|jgi:type I restriction enzyme S subunit|nr:MAG: hypothetical protein B7X60_00695 [Polynucleobacter sp. 39-45-136]
MSGIKTKFPSSWELVKLGDFVESQKGKKPKNESKAKSPSHPIPYVDIQAFEENIVRTWTDGVGCHPCYESDFLMVWDGSRSGLVGKGVNGVLGSTLVRINFPIMVNDYAYYFLKSKYQQINTRAKGSGTPHVDPDLLWNYDFPIPPLAEQHRIVAKIEELFSGLDKGVENLRLAQEQLNILRQSILKNAFEGKLTENWRQRNPGKVRLPEQLQIDIRLAQETLYGQLFDKWSRGKVGAVKPKPLKLLPPLSSEELSYLPKLAYSWTWVRLGNFISSIEAGKSFRCDEREPSMHEIGVAKVSAISWGEYDESESKTCTDKNKVNDAYLIKKDDFILSRSNTVELVGACVIAKNVSKKIMLSDKTLRINFIELKPEYILEFLRSRIGRKQIMDLSTGNQDSMRNIGQERIRSIAIPVCSNDEAIEVIQLSKVSIDEIDRLEAVIQSSLRHAEVLRQSILQKAFSGQLVPQDPNDEPATELLVRIKAEVTKSKPTKKKKAA